MSAVPGAAPVAAGELLRFATLGSVDDGKSTLIGRLLFDAKQVLTDQLEHVEEASRRRGAGMVDLSLLVDGLRAEREQGITIDVAYRYFATQRRRFIIADTPGHVRYTRNMVTGASTADVAIVLVDARHGLVQQTRRHAFIGSLLRVPHFVVAVNKMDLVGYDNQAYEAIVTDFTAFAAKLDIADLTFVPISALQGDNVVERSTRMPWYAGTALLHHLEHVHIASDRNLIDPRLPVQWVIREHETDYRGYAGQIAGGVWRVGDDVVVLPSGARSSIAAIDSFDGQLAEAFPPMSVAVRLADDIDVARGDMLCRPHNRPRVSRDIDALLCWMNETPAREGRRYIIKHTTRSAHCILQQVRHRIDVDTLSRDEAATGLALNEIGRIVLRTNIPLAFDAYRRNRLTGSFILIDMATNDTVAGGILLEPSEAPAVDVTSAGQRSSHVVWEPAALTRTERADALGSSGATVWFTGLPASGKSTIAGALERCLVEQGRPAYRLDGDNLRHGLNANLGFDPADRTENVRRTAHAAQLLADAGVIAIVSLVSPYEYDRQLAKSIHDDQGLWFLQVWVNTPLAECERRDPKGLYKLARKGDLSGMTGIDDPYEEPREADLELRPAPTDVCLAQVLALLAQHGLHGG